MMIFLIFINFNPRFNFIGCWISDLVEGNENMMYETFVGNISGCVSNKSDKIELSLDTSKDEILLDYKGNMFPIL